MAVGFCGPAERTLGSYVDFYEQLKNYYIAPNRQQQHQQLLK